MSKSFKSNFLNMRWEKFDKCDHCGNNASIVFNGVTYGLSKKSRHLCQKYLNNFMNEKMGL